MKESRVTACLRVLLFWYPLRRSSHRHTTLFVIMQLWCPRLSAAYMFFSGADRHFGASFPGWCVELRSPACHHRRHVVVITVVVVVAATAAIFTAFEVHAVLRCRTCVPQVPAAVVDADAGPQHRTRRAFCVLMASRTCRTARVTAAAGAGGMFSSLAPQAASKLEPLQALVLFISLGAMLRGLLLWSSLDPQMWARRWPSWRAMYVAVSSQLLLGV
jgi:hypothetical protein